MVRRILGDDIDPVLRPLLATTAFGFAGVFSFVAFFALWAIEELRVPRGQLGLALAGAAVAGVAGSFAGGRLSDRYGRKPVIVVAGAVQTVAAAALLLPGTGRPGAYAVLAILSFSQPLRGATQRALAADLAPSGRIEPWLAALRIAVNGGATLGPLGGALLVGAGWTALHVGTALAFALSLATALRLADTPPAREEANGPPLHRDRRLALVLVAAALSFMVYEAFQTLLPVSLAGTIEPAVWGAIFALNPILIVLLQLRITRWSSGLRTQAKVVLALALLGLPYLVLTATTALAVVAAIVVCAALGEMLLLPAAETLAAEIAPPGRRGAYMGASTAGNWLGSALAPAVGLQLAAAFGDGAMWIGVVAAAAAAAAVYITLAGERSDPVASAASSSESA